MVEKTTYIDLNGEFLPEDEARISAQSRVVMYGDGCFETLRSYKGKFIRFQAHMDRLRGAMNYLNLDVPPTLRMSEIRSQIHNLLEKNKLHDAQAIVRIQIWRDGGRGYITTGDEHSHYAITVSPVPNLSDSCSLAVVPTRRIPSKALDASFKLSNGLNYIRATTEARKRGAEGALMLTMDDFISETTIANVFWANDDNICTPDTRCDILPGVTRDILLETLRRDGTYEVREDQYTEQEIKQADCVWICNSVREVMPVHDIDGNLYKANHEIIQHAQKLFEDYKSTNLE